MPLTHAHHLALRADSVAAPTLSPLPHNADTAVFVADTYHLTAVPDCWVYRTALGEQESYEAASPEGTPWDWPTYIAQRPRASVQPPPHVRKERL